MEFNLSEKMKDGQREKFIQGLIDLLAECNLSPMAVISSDKIRFQGDPWPGIMIPVASSSVKQTVKEFSRNSGAKMPHYL